jgi:hypothetical protein
MTNTVNRITPTTASKLQLAYSSVIVSGLGIEINAGNQGQICNFGKCLEREREGESAKPKDRKRKTRGGSHGAMRGDQVTENAEVVLRRQALQMADRSAL